MPAPAFQVGFPLYDRRGRWEFVIVRGVESDTHELRWYKDDETGAKREASFINEVGAGDALNARPQNYITQGYDFLHVAEQEIGKPNRWRYKSDTVACVLGLAQSHHSKCAIPDQSTPIVLVSCSAHFGRGNGRYSEIELRKVSVHPNREQNLEALEQKWTAAVEGSKQFRILALVLHEADAKLLEPNAVPAIPLTEKTFHNLALSSAEQPALVKVSDGQMQLLAHALGVPAQNFAPASSISGTAGEREEGKSGERQPKRNKHWIAFFGISLAVISIAIVAWSYNRRPASQHHHRLTSSATNPSNVPPLPALADQGGGTATDLCTQSLGSANSFAPESQLRIRVLNFGGADAKSIQFGRDVGRKLRTALNSYLQKETTSERWNAEHLPSQAIEALPLDCYVNDHQAARKIGQATHADLVLWGDVAVSHDAKGSSQLILVPQITSTYWSSLQVTSSDHLPRYNSQSELYQMSFPQIATDEIASVVRLMLGVYAYQRHKYRLASSYLHEAKVAAAKQIWPLSILQAKSHIMDGQYIKGRAVLGETAKWCNGDAICDAEVELTRAWLAELLGEYEKAIQIVRDDALAKAQSTGILALHMDALSIIARNYEKQGSKTEAEQAIKQMQSLLIGQTGSDVQVCALKLKGALEKDVEAYKMSLELSKSAGIRHPGGEGNALASMGAIAFSKGDMDSALSYYKNAIDSFHQANYNRDEGAAFIRISEVFYRRAEYDRAILNLNRAVDLFQRFHDLDGELNAQGSLLVVNIAKRDKKRVKDNISGILSLLRIEGIDNFSTKSYLYDALVDGYILLANYRKALKYSRQGVATLLQKNPSGPIPVQLQKQATLERELALRGEASEDYLKAAGHFEREDEIKPAEKFQAYIPLMLESACLVAPLRKQQEVCRKALEYRVKDSDADAISTRARIYSILNQRTEAQNAYNELLNYMGQNQSDELTDIRQQVIGSRLSRLRSGVPFQGCLGVAVLDAGQCQKRDEINKGDILFKLNGACINNTVDYLWSIEKHKDAKSKVLHIWRDRHLLRIVKDNSKSCALRIAHL